MRISLCFVIRLACLCCAIALGACASQSKPQVDAIFQDVPGGRYACANAADPRGPVTQSLTGPVAQAMLGGAVGGLIGNQFGSHSGQDIATGVGAAAGVTAGAWNAQRMDKKRYAQCLRRQSYRY